MDEKSRNQPATGRQKELLSRCGVNFAEGITKGEASDLIGKIPAWDSSKDILDEHGVNYAKGITNAEADELIRGLKATKEQRKILRFFGKKVPTNLPYKVASEIINAIPEDEMDKYHAREDRLDDIECARESINHCREEFNSKSIPKKLFTEIYEELEGRGHSLEQIEEMEKEIFEMAIKRRPELKKTESPRKRVQSSGCLVILVPFLAVGLAFLFGSLLYASKTSDELLEELRDLEENWEKYQAKADTDAKVKAELQIAKEKNKPIIGMLGSEYVERFGSPDDKKVTKTEHGTHTMFIYKKNGKTIRFVHLKNGKVTGYTDY